MRCRRLIVAGAAWGLLAVAGCGNYITTEIVGALGVSVDRAGHPVLVVALCSGSLDYIDLYGPHQGSETTSQKPAGEWRASEPVGDGATVALPDPASPWTAKNDPGELSSGVRYNAEGGSTTEDQAVSPVDFTLNEVKRLDPGTVLSHRGTTTRAEFTAQSCS